MKDMIDVILGTDDGRTSVSGARWALSIGVISSLIGASFITRKRVAQDKEPILRVLF